MSIDRARLAPDWAPGKRPPPAVGALLRMAWESVLVEQGRALAEAGFGDIRNAHRPLFQYPGVEGLRPGEISTASGLSKQTVNDLLREMEAMGYLRLEPDEKDGRARIVRLTDRGRAMMEALRAHSASVGERWAGLVGRRRYDRFEETLRDIVEAAPQRSRQLADD